MLWFFPLIIVILFGALLAYWMMQGVAVFTLISYSILKLIVRFFGKNIGSEGADVAARLDEKVFGISREFEIVSGSLTDEFKAAAKGKLAPDMWHDGRRIYFEVGNQSYSVKTDLEGARKRKNELLAEQHPIRQAAR